MLSWYYRYSIKYNSIPQKTHVFCLALEQVYYTRNFTFTEQFPFSMSFVKWSFHRSKLSNALGVPALVQAAQLQCKISYNDHIKMNI